MFYGTTNDYEFLHDYTGNRRFWPIGVDKSQALYDVFSLTAEDIDQIWAEAVSWYAAGEPLYLSAEIASQAAEVQARYMVDNPKEGLIMEYLDTPIREVEIVPLSKSKHRAKKVTYYLKRFLPIEWMIYQVMKIKYKESHKPYSEKK